MKEVEHFDVTVIRAGPDDRAGRISNGGRKDHKNQLIHVGDSFLVRLPFFFFFFLVVTMFAESSALSRCGSRNEFLTAGLIAPESSLSKIDTVDSFDALARTKESPSDAQA